MAANYKEIEVRFSRNPVKSMAVGTLAEKDHNLFFEYDSGWLRRNLELSPFILPLQTTLIKHQDHRFGPLLPKPSRLSSFTENGGTVFIRAELMEKKWM